MDPQLSEWDALQACYEACQHGATDRNIRELVNAIYSLDIVHGERESRGYASVAMEIGGMVANQRLHPIAAYSLLDTLLQGWVAATGYTGEES